MLLFEVLRDVGASGTSWYTQMSLRDYRFLVGFKINCEILTAENRHIGKDMVNYLIQTTNGLCVAPLFVYLVVDGVTTDISGNDTFNLIFEDFDDAMVFKLKYSDHIEETGVWIRTDRESAFRTVESWDEIKMYHDLRNTLT